MQQLMQEAAAAVLNRLSFSPPENNILPYFYFDLDYVNESFRSTYLSMLRDEGFQASIVEHGLTHRIQIVLVPVQNADLSIKYLKQ